MPFLAPTSPRLPDTSRNSGVASPHLRLVEEPVNNASITAKWPRFLQIVGIVGIVGVTVFRGQTGKASQTPSGEI